MKKPSILIMILMMMAIQSALAQQGSNLVQYNNRHSHYVRSKSDIFVPIWFTKEDSVYHPQIRQIYRQGYYINTLGETVLVSDSNTLRFDWMKKGERIIKEIWEMQGRDEEKRRVWYDSITIKPNTSYSFSCHVRNPLAFSADLSDNTRNPNTDNLDLVLCVNGKRISKIFTALPNYEHIVILDGDRRQVISGKYTPGPEVIISGKFTSGPDQTRIEVSLNEIKENQVNGIDLRSIVFQEIQPEEYEKELVKKEERIAVITSAVKKEDAGIEIPPVKLEVQSTCSGSLGSPIFFENFGKQTSCYSSTALTTGTTNYNFKGIGPGPQRNPPDDGDYVIWCGSSAGTNWDLWHQTYYDHTTGTGSGTGSNMAIFNAAHKPGEFYRKAISGLCQNTNYTFSIYVANMANPANEVSACDGLASIKPNLTFKIFNTGTTTLLASSNTGEIPLSSRFTWLYYDFSFTTGADQTSVDVVLQNLAQGGCGNDLALDDISVRPCGPSLTISLSPGSSVNVGTSVTFNGTLGAGYTDPVYQWQSSTDGTTWTDIVKATSINYTIPSTVFTDSKQYRLLAAENGNLNNPNCRIISNTVTLTVTEIMSKIFFDNDKAELRQESKEELDKLYSILKSKPDFFIQVSGHTDDNASHEYNYVLSEARAVAVVQYLIDKGLDKNKFIAKGFGDTKPIASNEDEEGRQQNRRIEFMILDTHSNQLSLQDPSIIRPGDERYNLLKDDFKAVYLKQQADR